MSGSNKLVFLLSLVLLAALPACDQAVEPTSTFSDEYLHVRASWSPDGRTIAFTSYVENAMGIYLMDTLGGNIRKIFTGDGVGVTWSPDSKWIAFSQAGTLYKIKPTGDSLSIITDVQGAIRPSWAPNNKWIAFVQRSPGYGIWLFDVAKGTSALMLAYGDFPSWNPLTGEMILLSAQFDQSTGYVFYNYVAVDSAITSTRSIGSFATVADVGFSPMSPTGNRIALGVKKSDDYAQVWVFDLAARTITQLTTDGGDYPSWSPDGSKIIYTRTQPGDGGLWVMNADGSNQHRITKP
jgi:Tol biopolymer transport system component